VVITVKLHIVIAQIITVWILTIMKTSNLILYIFLAVDLLTCIYFQLFHVLLVGNKHNTNLLYMFIHNIVTVDTDFTYMSQWIVLVIFLLNILTINKKACEFTIFLGCDTL